MDRGRRRNRDNLAHLAIQDLVRRMTGVGGGRGGRRGRVGSIQDLEMEALNGRLGQPRRMRRGEDAVSQALAGSNIYRDPAGNWQIRGLEGASGEAGTGRTRVRGNGRAYASADPGTVSIGQVSSDTPPQITINGQPYEPDGQGGIRPKTGGTPPPSRQTGVYNPPPRVPPQGQGVGRTSTPTGAEVNPVEYPVTAQPEVSSGNPSYGRNFGRDAGYMGPEAQARQRNATLASGATPPEMTGSPNQPRPPQRPLTQAEVAARTAAAGGGTTTNPKDFLSEGQSSLSSLGDRIANRVRERISAGGQHQAIPGQDGGSFLQRAVSDIIRNASSQSQLPVVQEPQQLPGSAATGQAPSAGLPVVQGPQLPVIAGPQELPGSAVTGQAPSSGLPVIQGPQELPGSAVTGQAPGTTAAPASVAAPAPTTGSGVGAPQGVIDPTTSGLQLGNAQGLDWSQANQWDPIIVEAANRWGVDPALIKAAMIMESNGVADAQNPHSSSYGLLQIQPEWHAESAAQLGYDLNTPEGQVGYFAALISGNAPGQDIRGSTPMERYINNYQGPEAGQTDPSYTAAYQHDVEVLMGMINGAAPPVNPDDPNGSGLPVIEGPQQLPGSAVSGQPPGEEAIGADTTTARYPIVSGSVAPAPTPQSATTGLANGVAVPQGDGLGIYAGENADESWVSGMFPNGEGYVSTDYKQDVCQTYNPECCGGSGSYGSCLYTSNEIYLAGASQSVHPGYDIGAPAGTTFHAPMSGRVIGTSANSSDPACMSPGGTNECTWAGDYGIVMDGGTDAQGNPIYINYDHVGQSYAEGMVGQEIEAGTPLGTVGDVNHIHVEIHGYCPALGKMVVLDPSLVYAGYYETHSTCDGVV